ncbi:MAG TPA: O-succinylhomoserine sulfhydrylase [Gammaproteobacteria bacterium]|nr:O-succinylhomoserine sulfhydrylase [Gammaproteobacteria bacterium]
MKKNPPSWQTQAIRAGQIRSHEQENSEAIFPTSSFVFGSAEEAAAKFSGETAGNIYSRFTNPTVRTFEQRLAALENAERCVATGSGMAAILCTCMALLQSGDHVVCAREVFGSTVTLFNKYLHKFGIEFTFVKLSDLNSWQQAIQPNTKIFFCESPSNPLTDLVDIAALAQIAHQQDIRLVVDNCFCTPALQQPLNLGADVVIHSATKFIDGQGRCLGGAVCGDEQTLEEVFGFLRSAGPAMSPFNAWVFLKGLETLKVRMQAHCQNASQLAHWLTQQPKVTRVFYPGLPEHPQHQLAKEQQSDFGAIVSFELKGGRADAWALINQTEMLSITANLGDTKSTITHPATTTHGKLSEQQRSEAGIGDGLVRIAVGLEAVEDIQADLIAGLN